MTVKGNCDMLTLLRVWSFSCTFWNCFLLLYETQVVLEHERWHNRKLQYGSWGLWLRWQTFVLCKLLYL